MVSNMEVDDIETKSSPLIEVISETTTTENTTVDAMESEVVDEKENKPLEPWEERLLDAKEILSLITSSTSLQLRPTTKMHLEALGKRLQKEGEALQRVASTKSSNSTVSSASFPITTLAAVPEPTPVVTVTSSIPLSSSVKYVPIDRFAFDAGGYNDQFITLYVDLDNVGTVKQNVTCTFTKSSFDLVVKDLQNKSYRLYKDNLEKDIDPDKSKYVVKANKIVIKLSKVKTSEYGGYDYWTKLTDPKKSSKTGTANASDTKRKDDPSASIMDMMKQMYDEGDDNMKKIIGETMMKQRNGELGKDRPGKGGMDGMPDFGDMDDM